MTFWAEAKAQAGREYGARHWRWFAAAHFLRTAWPALAVPAALGLLYLAWHTITGLLDTHETARPILWALTAAAALTLTALTAGAIIRRLTGSPRRRRRFR